MVNETRVVLFSYDPKVERICAAAMRSCYSPHAGYDLYNFESPSAGGLEGEKAFDEERVRALLKKALDLGHHDILEHGVFTFDIQGVSRACSHQLVRHRIASYSQQSQRYVKVTRSGGYVRPPSIGSDAKIPVSIGGASLELRFEDVMDIARQVEEGYLKLGIRAEDTRYVRPNAAATNMVLSMNPRSLMHFLALRCAPDAQWEIRDVAWAMLAGASLIAPTIFETLPGAAGNKNLSEKLNAVNEAVRPAVTRLQEASTGELVEIPMRDVGLEHEVRSFVRKV